MGDDWGDVEVLFGEEPGHLIPGLPHFATDDAVHLEAFEDDLVEVDLLAGVAVDA